MRNLFTIEESKWLRENYPKDESQEETYRRFVAEFGGRHTLHSVVSHCKRSGVKKPYRRFEKGHRPWSSGLSKEEHKAHFSEKGYANMTSSHKRNFANTRAHEEMQVPKGYVIHDLGNGKSMVMRHDIYRCMKAGGFLGQGELTETIYETYLVKRMVEGATGKLVRELGDRNSKEYLTKLREKGLQKRRIEIVASKGDVELTFGSITEASNELNIPISLISRTLHGENKHCHGWGITRKQKEEQQ